MKLKSLILSLLIIPISLFGQSDLKEKVDEILKKYADSSSPGINIVISKKDQIVYTNQLGIANIEYNQPLTNKTKFQAGFLSQQFTAYAILLLESEGKLSLKDDIKIHLPEFNLIKNTVSIENLLTHSSGFYDYWALKAIAGWRNEDYFDKEIALKYATNQTKLNHIPNQEAYFSNTNYLLLAEIVARISGMSFKDFVAERIFKPFGLTNSFFNSDFNKVYTTKAYYYFDWGNGWQHENMIYCNPGAVGMVTTSEDFGKWLIQLNKHHANNDEIWKKLCSENTLFKEGKTQFTLGFQKEDGLHGNLIYQKGFYNGYRSYMAYSMDEKYGILVWSNNMSMNASKIAKEILNRILIPSTSKKATTQNSLKSNPTEQQVEIDADFIDKYIGHYFDKKEFHTKRIYLENDTLRLHDVDYDSHYKIIPISKNRFKIYNSTSSTFFEFSTPTKTKTLKIYRNNKVSESYTSFKPKNYTSKDLLEFEGIYYSKLLGVLYSIEIKNGKLIANHHRSGQIELRPSVKQMFVSNEWFFSSINFKMEEDSITGFYINTPEIKELFFMKLN